MKKRASLVAQLVKNLPTVCKTWVRSLGQEDPLEEGMATHSSVLAWRLPWTEEPGGYSPWGCKKWDTTERLTLSLFTSKDTNPRTQKQYCGELNKCAKSS